MQIRCHEKCQKGAGFKIHKISVEYKVINLFNYYFLLQNKKELIYLISMFPIPATVSTKLENVLENLISNSDKFN